MEKDYVRQIFKLIYEIETLAGYENRKRICFIIKEIMRITGKKYSDMLSSSF